MMDKIKKQVPIQKIVDLLCGPQNFYGWEDLEFYGAKGRHQR